MKRRPLLFVFESFAAGTFLGMLATTEEIPLKVRIVRIACALGGAAFLTLLVALFRATEKE